jgi:5-bromo-4-chloroindolyl phosphate hydrolysis protein
MNTNTGLRVSVGAICGIVAGWGTLSMLPSDPVSLLVSIGVTMVLGYLGFIGVGRMLYSYDTSVNIEHENKVRTKRIETEYGNFDNLVGTSKESFIKMIESAEEELNKTLKACTNQLEQDLIIKTVNLGYALIKEVKSDPSLYLDLRSFLNTNLKMLSKIVEQYNEFKWNNIADTKRDEFLIEYRNTLSSLNETFQSLSNKLLTANLNSFKIDMEVIQDEMKISR